MIYSHINMKANKKFFLSKHKIVYLYWPHKNVNLKFESNYIIKVLKRYVQKQLCKCVKTYFISEKLNNIWKLQVFTKSMVHSKTLYF
jgi:hypothetical protein